MLFPNLPEINLTHLRHITDDTGLLQHATYDIPHYEEGYCVDDNARALLLMTMLEVKAGLREEGLENLSTRYLAFVRYALNAKIGRFRNFFGYDRRWLEEQGAEDSHGRTLWALGFVAGHSCDRGRSNLSAELFRIALPSVPEFTSPRALAYTLLGIDAYMHDHDYSLLIEIRDLLANRLLQQFEGNGTQDWPWLEDTVTYCNARLPQSLLISGNRMGCERMIEVGLRSLEWLASIQKTEAGCYSPVGSNGFLKRGGKPALFDQQPVEACGMVSACLDAWRLTKREFWLDEARCAFDWFLGENVLQKSLYNPVYGGCCDGIHPDRINANQGAESTLSFLMALAELHSANRCSA